jgi:hypothetical protein
MKRIGLGLTLFAITLVAEAHSEWLSKEFRGNWNSPGQGAEEFLNTDCRPSGLDGIQMLGIQNGHQSPYNLHLSCRHDRNASVHYTVRMIDVPRGLVDAAVKPFLDNSNVRIGPFYFGKVDGPDGVDGFLLIEKTK